MQMLCSISTCPRSAAEQRSCTPDMLLQLTGAKQAVQAADVGFILRTLLQQRRIPACTERMGRKVNSHANPTLTCPDTLNTDLQPS